MGGPRAQVRAHSTLRTYARIDRQPLLGRAACPRRLDLERKRHDEQSPGVGRALDPDRPAEGLDAIVQTHESRAPAGLGSADAVVANREQQAARARRERNLDP